MKISQIILSIIATSTTVIAGNVGNIDTSIPIYTKLSKECFSEIQQSEIYEECINSNTFTEIDKLKETCERVLSDKCIKFYENPISYFPNCSNDEVMNKYSEYIKESSGILNSYYCTVNGDGKTCPSVEILIKNPSDISKDYMKDCEYKSCIAYQIEYNEIQKKYAKFYSEYFINDQTFSESESTKYFNNMIQNLKSTECTSKSKDDTTNTKLITEVTSGTNTIKAISTLLSLALLYIIF